MTVQHPMGYILGKLDSMVTLVGAILGKRVRSEELEVDAKPCEIYGRRGGVEYRLQG